MPFCTWHAPHFPSRLSARLATILSLCDIDALCAGARYQQHGMPMTVQQEAEYHRAMWIEHQRQMMEQGASMHGGPAMAFHQPNLMPVNVPMYQYTG